MSLNFRAAAFRSAQTGLSATYCYGLTKEFWKNTLSHTLGDNHEEHVSGRAGRSRDGRPLECVGCACLAYNLHDNSNELAKGSLRSRSDARDKSKRHRHRASRSYFCRDGLSAGLGENAPQLCGSFLSQLHSPAPVTGLFNLRSASTGTREAVSTAQWQAVPRPSGMPVCGARLQRLLGQATRWGAPSREGRPRPPPRAPRRVTTSTVSETAACPPERSGPSPVWAVPL